MDLLEYLKTLYPKHSTKMLEYYASLIRNHEEDKLPATREMKLYAEIDSKIKELEKKKDKLRLIILKQKKMLNHNFQLMSISKITSKTFNPIAFFNWVSSFVDEKMLEDLTVKTIDEKKFIQYEAKGLLEYDNIPSDCFKESEQWRISVSKAKIDNEQEL